MTTIDYHSESVLTMHADVLKLHLHVIQYAALVQLAMSPFGLIST